MKKTHFVPCVLWKIEKFWGFFVLFCFGKRIFFLSVFHEDKSVSLTWRKHQAFYIPEVHHIPFIPKFMNNLSSEWGKFLLTSYGVKSTLTQPPFPEITCISPVHLGDEYLLQKITECITCLFYYHNKSSPQRLHDD